MGFSPFGLLVSLAVLAPNLLLLRFPPATPIPAVDVPSPLTWLERAGQALCLVVPAITATGTLAPWWAAPVLAALALYYALWVRYFRKGHSVRALYRPLWKVPVPMAVLPVIAFLCSAGWLGNWWIAGAGVVLAAGHLPTAALIARAVR